MEEVILSMEKAAMERWRNGDPWGWTEPESIRQDGQELQNAENRLHRRDAGRLRTPDP